MKGFNSGQTIASVILSVLLGSGCYFLSLLNWKDIEKSFAYSQCGFCFMLIALIGVVLLIISVVARRQ